MTALERKMYNQLVKVRRQTARQVKANRLVERRQHAEDRMAAKLERAQRELALAEGWARTHGTDGVMVGVEAAPESGPAETQRLRGRAVAS